MDVRQALAGVATYSHLGGRDQAAQVHLDSVRAVPPPEFPPGLKVRVSGSGQSLPRVPWIALLDRDVTDTAQDGLYLCYLFTQDAGTVYLSMNQGATQHRRAAEASGLKGVAAQTAAVGAIANETAQLRQLLLDVIPTGSLTDIDLRSTGYLPRAYEAGNIAAVEYSLAQLPPVDELAADLDAFRVLYAASVELKDELAADRRVATSARSERKRIKHPPRPPEFKPKDSSDYRANVAASTQTKTRKHESLLEAFAGALVAAGHVPANNVHPRDLTITTATDVWLVEAKTVGASVEGAVRAAIGQLFAYRHFYYREQGEPDPRMLALFDASIGDAFVALLESLGIDAVYHHQGSWAGSERAIELVNPASQLEKSV